eukprot:scaffold3496_cov201-Pinguiococcus_pyrenoidosus.AAC.1
MLESLVGGKRVAPGVTGVTGVTGVRSRRDIEAAIPVRHAFANVSGIIAGHRRLSELRIARPRRVAALAHRLSAPKPFSTEWHQRRERPARLFEAIQSLISSACHEEASSLPGSAVSSGSRQRKPRNVGELCVQRLYGSRLLRHICMPFPFLGLHDWAGRGPVQKVGACARSCRLRFELMVRRNSGAAVVAPTRGTCRCRMFLLWSLAS